jgi:hypothetical protein
MGKSQKCRYIRSLIRMLRLRYNCKLIILTSKYPQYHHSPSNRIFEYCHDILGAFNYAIWWKTKGGWLETEITQNEHENTSRYMFNLALEQNLQRPQLEYAMMIHSTVFTPLHSSSASWNVKDLVDHVTYRVIILRISNYPQYHHSPRNWILPWHFGTHSPQRLLWNWKYPLPYIQN